MEKATRKRISDYPLNVRVFFYATLFVSFIGIMFFALQAHQAYQIVENGKFALVFCTTGLILAVIIIFALRSCIIPLIISAPFLKSIVLIFVISMVFFTLSLACYINHRYATENYITVNSKIADKKIYRVKGRNNYTIKIVGGGFTKSFDVSFDWYNSLRIGQYIAVKVRHGKLNFDFIDLNI